MRRPSLLLFVALAPLACTGRTAPLPIQGSTGGSNVVDAGEPQDSGIVDTGGPLDAGWVDVDAGPPNACGFAGDYDQTLRIGGTMQFYDGLAVLLSRDPLDVQLRDADEVIRLNLGGASLPADYTPGTLFWLQFGRELSMWENVALAMSDIAPNDGPGRARVIAWSFGDADDFEVELDEIQARYETDGCEAANIAGCGEAQTESLVLVARGIETRVRAGEVQFFRTLEAGNGRSYRYSPFPTCTDTPLYWNEGYISVF